MEILIINNNTKYLKDLKKILSNHKLKILGFNEIESLNFNPDCIILSGGSSFSIENHIEYYKKEINIIKKTEIPIIGICLGFELIIKAFGGKLEKRDKRCKGIHKIKIVEMDKIFSGIKKEFEVYENHLWEIKRLKNLKILAKEEDKISVVKHSEKSIYGVSFHPEKFIDKTQGRKMLNNFLKLK